MTTFDDIDDFDGYNFILESYPAYTAAAAVSWADISAGEIEEDVGPTSFKKIVVTAQNDMLSNPVSLTTIMSTAGSGGAQIIAEEEQNNSFATAQEIPRTSFYATENPDVGNANNPWATINSNMDYGRDDDYYQFELQAGETLILDIDYGYDPHDEVDGVDTFMRLYNNQRVEKQWLDDSNTNLDGGAGSIDRRDPYLEWPAQDNGVYYVKVTSCQNDGTRCSDANPTDTGNYVLNVTIIPTDESTGLGDD
jgi:hypothetical protein